MSLPPGPKTPTFLQGMGWWNRPTAYLERCRARFGKRFTAPPDVLHPGEGARILEPVVGRHSVILLDEDPHLEQRKLMLPAFHGDKMKRLTGLMTEVAEREADSWPHGEE